MPALETRPALVSRSPVRPSDPELFLQLSADGAPNWTNNPAAATLFDSMREAAREAFRLPAAVRAFGVPLVAADRLH